jgi:hypothetical protein
MGVPAPAKQSQKNGLQYIFRISWIASDPVGGPEHKTVVGPESSLEFVRNRDCRFL